LSTIQNPSKADQDTNGTKPTANPDMRRWRRSIGIRLRSVVERGKRGISGSRWDNANSKPRADSILSTGVAWTDNLSDMDITFINRSAIDYFIKSAKMAKKMPETTFPSSEEVLRKLGMVSRIGMITLAAALLFGKPNDAVDGSIVKIGVFSEEGELVREEIIDIPVIMQPDAVMEALFGKYIPDTFEYVGIRRVVVNRYPRKAIREAVVNAIVHKQYESREPILIRISKDSLEIYNPGELPSKWVAEDLMRKHHSVRRNKKMAEAFYEVGFSESWGKGIGMMCESCKENGNPPPEFTIRHGGLEVMFEANDTKHAIALRLSEQSLAAESDDDDSAVVNAPARSGVSAARSSSEQDRHLSNSEYAICKMIRENPRVTANMISSSTGLSERHIYRVIKDLSDRGIIFREGSKKKGLWKLDDETQRHLV